MACQTLCSPSCRAHGLCSHAGSVSLPEELLHCTPRWINKEEKSQTLFTWRGGKMRSRGQRWRKSSRGSQGENNLIKWEKTEWCGRESESSGAKGEQCPGLTRAAESAQSQQRRPADLLLYRTGSSWCVPPRRHAFHTITSSSNNTINEHLFFFLPTERCYRFRGNLRSPVRKYQVRTNINTLHTFPAHYLLPSRSHANLIAVKSMDGR